MSEFIAENRGADAITRPNWSAVFSVAFCVACLIIVEFLPVSLLTPMAQDLGISEGVAGQSVTVTAFVAMFASLFITQTIQATDRRYVVILFAVLLTLSCLLVFFANSFSLLLIGRACLGLALGGFWAMSASLTMRLVPPRTVPKALSVIFGAVSIALVIAAPLGSFLGELIGWRNVFNAAAVMGVLCIFWIIKSLPSLPGEPSHQKQNTFRLFTTSGCDGRDDRHLHVFRRAVCFLHVYSPGVYEPGGIRRGWLNAGAVEFWYRQLYWYVAFVVHS
ncbi:MFS transporter [Escherichia coli]|nr:MFS transporter [Escherichia coli]